MFGCYKSQKHYDWILKNNLYNVRLGERRGAVNKNDAFVVCATHLVLYNFKNPTKFTIWRLGDELTIFTKEKMENEGYPTPQGEYLLYSLKEELTNDKGIRVQKILEQNQVQQDATLEGAPIYLTSEDLQNT